MNQKMKENHNIQMLRMQLMKFKKKNNLNDLLNIAGEEKKSKMILLEQESYAHTKTRGMYSDEKTKNQD